MCYSNSQKITELYATNTVQREKTAMGPMLLYDEGVSVTDGEFCIDASEINSLTDWQDQDLQLPKTRNGKDVFRFSTRERRIVMTLQLKGGRTNSKRV